eukprot:TRINITY_DN3083_c0_g1_i1.p1 TRINITY_DN3083_c0_g1~~TRINITY_DN3083_c0_g1_i1.p1  ORF type:complete len:509 (-),score=136.27 TRINITY_DN3083_c0_g1_i1:47-1573(-)
MMILLKLIQFLDFPPLPSSKQTARSFQTKSQKSSTADLSQEEQDRLFALQLQEQFNNFDTEEPEKSVPQPKKSEPVDEDYILALKIQAELNGQTFEGFDVEQEEEKEEEEEENTNSILPFKFQIGSKIKEQNFDDEREEEEDDYDEEYEDYDNPDDYLNSKEFITKHDLHMAKMENSIKIEHFHTAAGNLKNLGVGNTAFNSLRKDTKKIDGDRFKVQSNKKDKSAHDTVVDTATRMLLFRMLNSGFLDQFNGIVSVGKEAHVYHGIGGNNPDIPTAIPGAEYAVKIFKTDSSSFKDRSMYVDGEKRFKNMPNQNSGKVIKIWAEKEMRNLRRMKEAGILCPTPILLRKNIVVMTFLGKDGVPAPRLKDAKIKGEKKEDLYVQCALMLRKLYQECWLVHADFSEYNILYHRGKLWFIDVSQSVERDHVNADMFLKRDCGAITKFWRRVGVNVLGTSELLDYVKEEGIEKEESLSHFVELLRRNDGDEDSQEEEDNQEEEEGLEMTEEH